MTRILLFVALVCFIVAALSYFFAGIPAVPLIAVGLAAWVGSGVVPSVKEG